MSTSLLSTSLLAGVTKTLAGLVAVAALLTHLTLGFGPFFYGVLAAGVLQIANLGALTWFGARLTEAAPRGAAAYALLFLLKIGALIALALWMLKTLPVDPFGFMVGVALLIPAALVATVIQPLSATAEPMEVEA